MKYDDALKAWGALNMEHLLGEGEEIDIDSVVVTLEGSAGYGCSCSGEVNMEVTIWGKTKVGRSLGYDRDANWWSFEDFLKEVVEAANGAVTLD